MKTFLDPSAQKVIIDKGSALLLYYKKYQAIGKCHDREEYASVDIAERGWLVEILMEKMLKVALEQ